MSERTRSGELTKPPCPNCGKPLRVKPQPRTVKVPLWQCAECLKTRPADECEWTNAMLQFALLPADDEPDHPAPAQPTPADGTEGPPFKMGDRVRLRFASGSTPKVLAAYGEYVKLEFADSSRGEFLAADCTLVTPAGKPSEPGFPRTFVYTKNVDDQITFTSAGDRPRCGDGDHWSLREAESSKLWREITPAEPAKGENYEQKWNDAMAEVSRLRATGRKGVESVTGELAKVQTQLAQLTAERDAAEERLRLAQHTIQEHEENGSEVVCEHIMDANGIPLMRCTPNLPKVVAALHAKVAEYQTIHADAIAQLTERLKESGASKLPGNWRNGKDIQEIEQLRADLTAAVRRAEDAEGRAERLRACLENLTKATTDTLKSHPETVCCSLTRKYVNEAATALALAPTTGGQGEGEKSSWQPISTAPKDGTVFWAWLRLEGAPGFYQDTCAWYATPYNRTGGGWWVSRTMPCEPTHWMPLPSSPRTGSDG